jgi:hypothetical protein
MANERTSLYLPAETKQALAEYQERTKAENMSAAADDLIQRGLVAASTHAVGALAAPAIEEAVARKVEELLRALVVGPLHEELAAIRTEATVARLEGFAHIANDYGTEVAERTEAAAEERARSAPASDALVRLNMRVVNQTEQVA